jgi:hypothetical protein
MARRTTKVGTYRTRNGRKVKGHRRLQPKRAAKNAQLAARRLRQKQYAAGSVLATAATAEIVGWGAAVLVAILCLGAGLLLIGGGTKLRGLTK